jgi:methyl-accepting chemotaxis protein
MGDTYCWDVQGCKVKDQCPAYPHYGRDCFAVPGTLCGGEKQGEFRDKIDKCRKCEFYHLAMGLGVERPVRAKG